MKPKILVLWHMASNYLATAQIDETGLPLLTVCDEEYKGINPFYADQDTWLCEYYGWVKVGEL